MVGSTPFQPIRKMVMFRVNKIALSIHCYLVCLCKNNMYIRYDNNNTILAITNWWGAGLERDITFDNICTKWLLSENFTTEILAAWCYPLFSMHAFLSLRIQGTPTIKGKVDFHIPLSLAVSNHQSKPKTVPLWQFCYPLFFFLSNQMSLTFHSCLLKFLAEQK